MTASQRSKSIWPMTDSRRAIVSAGSHRYASSSTTISKSQNASSMGDNAPKRRSSERPFIRKTSFRSSKASLIRRYYEWKNEHMYLGRYSIEKLLAFEEYQRKVSRSRVFAVIVLTPLPALIIVLILAAIPLESPLLPASSNAAYFIQSWLSFTVVTFGMLLYIRCALALPENIYSHRECAIIALLISGANELIMVILSVLWRFPIPLRDMLGTPSYLVFFVLFHVAILRSKLRHYYDRIRSYSPLYLAQLAIFFIFEGIAILFKLSPVWTKAGIVMAFPLVRTTLKHTIIKFSHSLEDISTEVSLCVVEVFGSLFQNVCLQTSRSLLVTGLIMLLDFIQTIVEVQMHMDHRFVVDGKHCVQTAVKIVQGALYPGEVNPHRRDSSSDSYDKHSFAKLSCPGVSLTIAATDIFSQPKKAAKPAPRPHRSSKIACLASGSSTLDLGVIQLGVLDQELLDKDPKTSQNPETKSGRTRRSSIDDVEIAHRHHAKLLTQTLQLMYASEVLVFAEYAESASAFIYGLYTLTLYHFPYAKYSLCFIGLSESEFWNSVLNCAVYTVLEGFTLIVFFVSVRRKFGISPLYQLAFVLEKYWMSVQGKITSSLVLVFILHTVHQGTDLSLEFNWENLLDGHNH